MRLRIVNIKNFKGLRDITISIPETNPLRTGSGDFLTILGQNNVGKSSILEAIRLALPGSDISKPSIDHFPNKTIENGPIEVEFEFFDLTEEDRSQQGIRTHVFNDKYKIKKTWAEPNKGPAVFAYHPSVEIPSWPENDNAKRSFMEINETWTEAINTCEANRGTEIPNRVTNSIKEEIRRFLIEMNSTLVQETGPSWQENPGGLQSIVDSILPRLIFVPALKHTKEEAGITEKNSAARQIVEAMFSTELANNRAVQLFSEAATAVKEIFTGDGDGNEIIKNLEDRISLKLNRLIPLSAKLDFTPPDFTTDLASKTVLELSDGNVITKPEHQGHGAQRALVISLLELFAEMTNQRALDQFDRKYLLLVEEPEIYLHPQMCRKMRDVLLSIARSGTAQVICTSHSPFFLNVADRHDGICILRKENNTLSVIQRNDDLFPDDTMRDARNRLRMLLDFDPSVLESFFASRVCLVEGDCEVAAIEAIAARLIDTQILNTEDYLNIRRDLVIVNCRGKWTIRAFQRVLNGFNIPYIVVHDADNEGETGANAEIIRELDGQEINRLVHLPNFERSIFQQEWSRDKPWKATKKIHEMTQLNDGLLRFFYFVTGIVPLQQREAADEAAATLT